MAILTVTTPFNIEVEFKLAAFHKRMLATLIDLAVMSAFTAIIIYVIAPRFKSMTFSTEYIVWNMCIAMPCFLYPLLSESFLNGQTVGKRAMGLKVMDDEGDEPSFSQYLRRFLFSFANYSIFVLPTLIATGYFLFLFFQIPLVFGILYLPDVLSVAISKKSKRLGDLGAGTVVIDTRAKTGINETIYLEIDRPDYVPAFPQVMKLSDRDINGIRNLLAMKSGSRELDTYMIEVSFRIKKVLNIDSELHPRDFLQLLLQDYNALTQK